MSSARDDRFGSAEHPADRVLAGRPRPSQAALAARAAYDLSTGRAPTAAAMRALQRRAGNRAVAQHMVTADGDGHQWAGPPLARSPVAEAKPPRTASGDADEERADAADARPGWYRMDSSQDVLPGDPVPGITDAHRDLTEQDRRDLLQRLDRRLDANSTRVENFVLDFDRAARHVWTSYVAHEMKDALQDAHWPTWAKLLSFTVREALVALFSVNVVAMGASHMIAHALEKAAEYQAEQAHEKIHESGQTSKQRAREAALIEQAAAFSDVIKPSLEAALRPLAQGHFYRRWLEHVPLTVLHKFRLPPLCPKVGSDRMRFLLAENMAAFAWDTRYGIPRAGQQNLIDVRLTADRLGHFTTNSVSFVGADAFREAFAGVPVSQLPHVPLHVEVSGGLRPEDISTEGMAIWGTSPLEQVFWSYKKGEQTRIYRASGTNDIVVSTAGSSPDPLQPQGALGTHLALARLADPALDVAALVKAAMAGTQGPPYPAKRLTDVIRSLRTRLDPLVRAGAQVLVEDEIMPRVIVPPRTPK